MNSTDKKSFVLNVDAQSRIAIEMINNAGSPQIAQIGFSYDAIEDKSISRDGLCAVSGDASCIQVLTVSQSPSLFPVAYNKTPLNQTFIPAKPTDMITLVSYSGQIDYNFLCGKLGLDKNDYDGIKKGIFIRTFVDDRVKLSSGWLELPIYNHMGTLLRKNVFFQENLFELKVFKFVDRPFLYFFLFKPEHPGVWFRDGVPESGKTIILDTDINAVVNGTSLGNAGLINAGDIGELDYEVFLSHPVQCIWHSDTLQSRNRFAEAIHFISEAKKHGIDVSILKICRPPEPDEILDLSAVIKQARRYGLCVPANLKDRNFVHVSSRQKEFVSDDIPFFWSKGSSTLFFSAGYRAMLKNLLAAFCRNSKGAQDTSKVMPKPNKSGMRYGVFPRKRVGVFYPAQAESRTKRVIGETGLNIPCISSDILQEEDALETALYQNDVEILCIVYPEKISPKDLADVLDLCERIEVLTGIFSPVADEKRPSPEDVLKGTSMELVAQSYLVYVVGDSVIARNMATEISERYTFEKDGRVSVNKWDEPSDSEEY